MRRCGCAAAAASARGGGVKRQAATTQRDRERDRHFRLDTAREAPCRSRIAGCGPRRQPPAVERRKGEEAGEQGELCQKHPPVGGRPESRRASDLDYRLSKAGRDHQRDDGGSEPREPVERGGGRSVAVAQRKRQRDQRADPDGDTGTCRKSTVVSLRMRGAACPVLVSLRRQPQRHDASVRRIEICFTRRPISPISSASPARRTAVA